MERTSVIQIPRRRDGTIINRIGWVIYALVGLLVVRVLVLGFMDNPNVFIRQIVNGLQLGFVYALIALGYTMIYGVVKLINFAHGDVFMVGAFVSYFAVKNMNLHLWPAAVFPGLPYSVVIFIGTVTVMLLSMLISLLLAITMERFAYKPLRNAPRIAALITAIGVSFFLEYFGALPFVFTNNYITYYRPFDIVVFESTNVSPTLIAGLWAVFLGGAGLDIAFRFLGKRDERFLAWRKSPLLQFALLTGGFLAPLLTLVKTNAYIGDTQIDIKVSNIVLLIMVVSIILQVLLSYIVQQTKLGKAMRATAYDKPVARLMGINVDNVISATFALGGSLAGAAGMLYAIAFKQVHHLMGIIPGLKAFVAAVVGGIGSVPGAFLGALIMGQTEVLSAGFISTPMRDAISFSLLIIVLLIRPTGILGEPEGEKV